MVKKVIEEKTDDKKVLELKSLAYDHVMNIERHKLGIQKSQQVLKQINKELNELVKKK